MPGKRKKRIVGKIIWGPRKGHIKENGTSSGWMSQPSVYHALIVIFLEFFAWGLLTSPMIMVLNETFPNHTLLLNGLITGVKGMLSFLSAPLIGALSDVWGRKTFLLLTVSFTCAPIPLMKISPMWYFAMISISGIFSVTFSVVFAYVADVTTEEDRGQAYGLVSATFAASLVTSPALGSYLEQAYSENLVVWLATAVALLDILFILVWVPESLPEKLRPASWGSQISWDKADPFGALKKIGQDQLILLLCVAVFLSYLPEAGEYSCFFVYLRLRMGFSAEAVASYIALVGVLSVIAQTLILTVLMKYLGHKGAIMFGLVFEIIQLACYGFGSQDWIMWVAGCMAAMSSVTYPAISAFASSHASADQQGVAQGVITGIRGLCNGFGPAMFGFIFYLFQVDLKEAPTVDTKTNTLAANATAHPSVINPIESMIPGPPFAFGTILVIMALLVAIFVPESPHSSVGKGSSRRTASSTVETFSQESGHQSIENEPLMNDSEQEV
ncbi:hippocampus abundant transcript 1 protein-like [Mizuhopecten yessoensis]|uniref:Hippocampus abundant transcript 1 protein n=1 Tax=Mizuhopecten yessoensis TaxID=6573 RepID=A0A210QAI2_MIZYE|nr:hippocampus abundant transcript 1 protein-like [Mizuhopecten yessoensis]OWF45741.1 Hippocampus abundant transcript 1 protein [Mizuhopecten yessoensis]